MTEAQIPIVPKMKTVILHTEVVDQFIKAVKEKLGVKYKRKNLRGYQQQSLYLPGVSTAILSTTP